MAYFYFASSAEATGGAYPNTKHGGSTAVDAGVWCPAAPCGVDRTFGGEYGYYSDAADGGKYQAGECSHCHDLHMSFGGSEQKPTNASAPTTDTTTTPDMYSLFAPGTREYCYYCHETMSLGMPPDPAKTGWGYWRVYQGKTKYDASAHVTSGNMKWPGANAALSGNITTFPRNFNRNALGLNAGDCVNCHTPHGMQGDGVAATTYDTTTIASANQTVAAARPDITTNYLIPRMLVAWEEALCLNCHRSAGTGGTTATPDIATQLPKLSGHPIDDLTLVGRHRTSEYNDVTTTGQIAGVQWNSIAAGTRHSECVDCHNPHVAQAITVTSPAGINADRTNYTKAQRSAEMIRIRGPLLGSWGAKPATHVGVYASLGAGFFAANWPAPAAAGYPYPTTGWVTSYSKVSFDSVSGTDMYEAYLCLKCHSYFAFGAAGPAATVTTGSGTYPQTEVTRDFNPRNLGYHPVFNRGQNRPGALNATFDTAFNNARGIYLDSYITCTDCHASDVQTDPRGPHGSANAYLLRGNEAGGVSTWLCYNCHLQAVYGSTGGAGPGLPSHVIHPPDNTRLDVYAAAKLPTAPMPAIGCMNCHGGGRFGGIHGSNEPVAFGVSSRGSRLINGAAWTGWNGTAAAPACWTIANTGVIAGYTNYTLCTQNHGAAANNNGYTYTYTPVNYDP
ncbi:MAG: cytochrome c3 family protein [Deltaproteobacteria bacterium]|nr:cytochrome c3 family protein [Deltaproteobacteria bacterium]